MRLLFFRNMLDYQVVSSEFKSIVETWSGSAEPSLLFGNELALHMGLVPLVTWFEAIIANHSCVYCVCSILGISPYTLSVGGGSIFILPLL